MEQLQNGFKSIVSYYIDCLGSCDELRPLLEGIGSTSELVDAITCGIMQDEDVWRTICNDLDGLILQAINNK